MTDPSGLTVLASTGVVGGLVLLARGMRGYLESGRISGIGTSTIASVSAGEVRLSGTVEPAEVLLVSPLASRRCVWYRASISDSGDRAGSEHAWDDERAVGFRVRDATGTIRVFPRDGRFDAPDALAVSTGLLGDAPPELQLRHGPPMEAVADDRAALIERLTTVAAPERDLDGLDRLVGSTRAQHYREARIEPGDVVTIVGAAVPFGEIGDPLDADAAGGAGSWDGGGADPRGVGDPEVAADVAAARASGALAASADEAWGNAAIPGFGIGRPSRQPTLDPRATPEPAVASPPTTSTDGTDRAAWDLAADTLVVAAAPGVPLLVAAGAPGLAAARGDERFLVGLLGAALSIGSAIVLAVVVTGGLR